MTLGTFPFGSAPLGGGPLGSPGPQPGAPAGLSLRIGPLANGTDYLFYRSWRLREQLNGRNTCTCTLLASDGLRPLLGQDFILELNGTRIFAGSIFSRRTRFLFDGGNDWLVHELECTDWNRLCDRRRIGEPYVNQTLGAIVRDIVAKTIGQEGISDAGVEEGPLLDRVVFPNVLVSQAFDLLSERTGYYWTVDYSKTLHFFARSTAQAPFPIVNDVNAVLKWRKYADEESLAQYRNSQFVDGGQAVTVPLREVLPSNGETRTYTASGPLASKPALDVNGVPVDPAEIGLRGQDENKSFYWAQGEPTITREQSLPPLATTDPLGVTATYYYDLDVVATDFAGVAERKSIEGGTGLYEHVQVETSLDGEEVITAKAAALLNRYSLSREKEFELDQPGLAVGQQVLVTVPQIWSTNEPHLITEMETENLVLNERRFHVRCSTGELKGTFTEFWKRVHQQNPVRINPDAVVQSVVPMYDEAAVTDLVTATLSDYLPAEWGTAVVGEDEWG